MIAYSDGNARDILAARPTLDRSGTAALAGTLFPSEKLEALDDGNLGHTCPEPDELVIGCFPGLSIVSATDFALDRPSLLPAHFLEHGSGRVVYLHAMHSMVDWLAFAIWKDQTLERSLSLAPDAGIIEDIGSRMPFEESYWAGRHPATRSDGDQKSLYPFAFHPLELGEAALRDFFGYQLEGFRLIDTTTIPLARYKRETPSWKFW